MIYILRCNETNNQAKFEKNDSNYNNYNDNILVYDEEYKYQLWLASCLISPYLSRCLSRCLSRGSPGLRPRSPQHGVGVMRKCSS